VDRFGVLSNRPYTSFVLAAHFLLPPEPRSSFMRGQTPTDNLPQTLRSYCRRWQYTGLNPQKWDGPHYHRFETNS